MPGIANVTTFNAPRPPIISTVTAGTVNQINIIARGDFVGDPRKSISDFNAGYLPGKTYSVQSTSAVPQSQLSGLQGKWDPYASDTHTLSGIIGGLKNAAASKPGSPAIPQAEQPARQSTAVVPQTPAPSIQTIQSNSRVAARTQPHNAIVSNPPASSVPSAAITGFRPTPGGVSLSRAAAERMPLQIALDASALADGKIVLSGRASESRMDAALFLTALRAACDDRDPYFSLDPDDGILWTQQGDQASNEFWEKIKKDFS